MAAGRRRLGRPWGCRSPHPLPAALLRHAERDVRALGVRDDGALRGLHDEVHVTTVFVTHDQEEALEVADQIVVINDGAIEQVGSPDDLYDRPASEFVMSFLGPVTTLVGRLIRPHDLDVRTEPFPDAYVGRIADLNRVGFEVRLDIELDDERQLTPVHVTQTRAEAAAKRLAVGDRVWIKPVPGSSQFPLTAAVAPAAVPELQPLVS